MKASNKKRSERRSAYAGQAAATYPTEAERGDFKRRKMTVFTGYAIFIAIMIIVML
jgi:ribosomal protein L32